VLLKKKNTARKGVCAMKPVVKGTSFVLVHTPNIMTGSRNHIHIGESREQGFGISTKSYPVY